MTRAIELSYSKKESKPVFKYIDKETKELRALDLEVSVKAISLNPVDYKVGSGVKSENSPSQILGWDASGVISKLGSEVSTFKVGDEIYYAGDITRDGANSDFHIVDSRIVAKKPKQLSFKEAAALPLTSLTSWEGLFDGLKINPQDTKNKSLLVIGGAGGVGSMVVQLAKALTDLKVIATASRGESVSWAKKMGADYIVNYKNDLKEELQGIGFDEVDYVFCTNNTESYFPYFPKIIKPFGGIVSIVEISKPVDIGSLMSKSISFSWEFMFTRSMFQSSDIKRQSDVLYEVSKLIQERKIISTMNKDLGEMTPDNIKKGHELLKQGHSVGKIVLGGLK